MSEKSVRVAILSTGDEVVEGRTVDTNASYIADRVASLGYDVVAQLTVGDFPDRLQWAWRRALELADVVISTGGLGPTADDLTNETVAAVAGVELVLDQEQADKIRNFFESLGRHMPENNLKQAELPVGCEVVPNNLGTAPGYRLVFPDGDRRPVGVVLPGVPREMKAMLEEQVIPWLASLGRDDVEVLSHTFQTFGMSESGLDEAVAGLIEPDEGRVAFRASFPQIAVRITVVGNPDEASGRLDELAGRVRNAIGSAVYAEGDDATMEGTVGALLTERGLTLATAESCTGGLIGNRLTDVPGSSGYYRGGIVAYENKVKQEQLGVSRTTLSMFGAVSEETACEMALGARKALGTDLAIATTGIAGPGGGTEEKPVGTVAVALAFGEGDGDVKSKMYQLWGTRDWVKTLTSQVALDWVRRQLLGMDPLESNFGRRGGRRGAGR